MRPPGSFTAGISVNWTSKRERSLERSKSTRFPWRTRHVAHVPVSFSLAAFHSSNFGSAGVFLSEFDFDSIRTKFKRVSCAGCSHPPASSRTRSERIPGLLGYLVGCSCTGASTSLIPTRLAAAKMMLTTTSSLSLQRSHNRHWLQQP